MPYAGPRIEEVPMNLRYIDLRAEQVFEQLTGRQSADWTDDERRLALYAAQLQSRLQQVQSRGYRAPLSLGTLRGERCGEAG